MIGKVLKGKSFKGAISYVIEAKDAKLLYSEGVLDVDKNTIINSFYMQSLLNPKLSKCVGHIPLAFSPEDKSRLTDDFMIQLAREYMKEMKIKNTQYIIVRHNNTDHPHLHIVFNRVDNDGKTISDSNDRYRNEKVCKLLKDRYNLTYGKGKEKVNVQKLKGTEKTKYEIYHAIKKTLPKSKNWNQFEQTLKNQGVDIGYKYKGQTDEVQGISFKKDKHSFKGSDIDRKFNYSKLDAVIERNNNQHQHATIPHEIKSNPAENILSTATEIVSGLGGLLDFQPSNSDEEEAEYLRQQALKKKKPQQKRGGFKL